MERNKYSNFKKSEEGRSAGLIFKSQGRESDLNNIFEAMTQAYENKLSCHFIRDDFNTISLCFSGLPENIERLELYYNQK